MYAWSCPAVCPSDIKPDNKPIRDELHTSPTSNQTWPWHYKYLTPAHTNRVIKNAHIDLATCIRQKQITLIQTPAIIISQTIAATLSVTRTIKGNVGVFLLLQNDNLYQWTHQRSNFPFHPNSSLPTEEVALSLIGCLPAWQTWKHLKLRNGNWTCPLPGRYSAYIYFQMHETEKKDVLLGQSLAVGKTRQQVAQMTLRWGPCFGGATRTAFTSEALLKFYWAPYWNTSQSRHVFIPKSDTLVDLKSQVQVGHWYQVP